MTDYQKDDKFVRLREQAEDLIRQGRADFAPEAAENMRELIQELKVHQAELEIQNQELKRAKQEISSLHQEYQELYEFAPCGYLTLNPKGIITRANLTAVSLLWRNRSILLRSSLTAFIASDWVDQYQSAKQQAIRSGDKQSVELQLQTGAKELKWVLVDIDADKDDQGTLAQLRMVMMDITERKQTERQLKRIQWMLQPGDGLQESVFPEYGDLVELNTRRVILDAVGRDLLTDIVNDFLSLLETSVAVYEANGDYALGIFSSKWCRFMDAASRRLCNTPNNHQALTCGKWLCYESCWETAQACMEKQEPVDVECAGGIKLYAVPIFSQGKVIGSINLGYGDPPKDRATLNNLAAKYHASAQELMLRANAYETRPPFLVENAKHRMQTAARLIGEIVERRQAEEKVFDLNFFLGSVLNSFSDHLTVLDEQGRIILVNQAWREFAQANHLPPRQVSEGTNYLYVCSNAKGKNSEGAEAFANGIREVISGEKDFYSLEYPCHSPARHRWFIGRVTPFEEKSPRRVVVCHEEITERKQAELALQNSEARFRSLIESSPDAVFVSLDQCFSYVNKAALELFGAKSKEQLVGRPVLDQVHPMFRDQIRKRHQSSTKGKELLDVSGEIICLRLDGSEVPVECSASHIIYSDQNALLVFARDITERKQLEQLKEDVDRITRHDLKTPLNGIIGMPQLLLSEENLNEEQKELIEHIRQAGYRMLNMINMSLILYQMEKGEYNFHPQPTDIMPIIQDIRTDLSSLCSSYKNNISVSLANTDQGNIFVISGEGLLCYTMLSNLIKNAVERTPAGETVYIQLEEPEANQAKISIHNPKAIPEKIQDKIGQKYVTAEKKQGTGLGIYSARLIARTMQGSLTWNSSRESGTCFTVYLPIPDQALRK